MTGDDLIPNGIVVVENGLITAVGTEVEVTIPNGATIIDLEGRTILPGLIDARNSDLLRRLQLKDGQVNSIPVKTYLTSQLEQGVTTVRAMGWTWEEMQGIPELKKALDEYGNTIPSVFIAGASLAHSEGPAYKK